MEKSDLIDLLSNSGSIDIRCGKKEGGGDYWSISLTYPSAYISGFKSFLECAEEAIKFKAAKEKGETR